MPTLEIEFVHLLQYYDPFSTKSNIGTNNCFYIINSYFYISYLVYLFLCVVTLRCKACDVLLTDAESMLKSTKLGDYLDLCWKCIESIPDLEDVVDNSRKNPKSRWPD